MTHRKSRRLGQAMIEYVILVGLLAFAVIGGTKAFGYALSGAFNMAEKQVVGIEAEMAKQDQGTGSGPSGARSPSLTNRKDLDQHRTAGRHTWTYDRAGRFCAACGEKG